MMDHEASLALRNRITALFIAGDLDAGLRLMEENAAQLPESVRLECLGNWHFYRRDFQRAVECYEGAIELAPENVVSRYQYLAGVKSERARDFVTAFKRYQAAIDADPSFVDAYVELGGLLIKVSDLEGAVRCYRDAARLDPSNITNWQNLRSALLQLPKADRDRYHEELQTAEINLQKRKSQGQCLPISEAKKW